MTHDVAAVLLLLLHVPGASGPEQHLVTICREGENARILHHACALMPATMAIHGCCKHAGQAGTRSLTMQQCFRIVL